MANQNLVNDTAELTQYLNVAGAAVTNSRIREDLGWGEGRLNSAKKQLLRQRAIYTTQEGLILQEHASPEQQIWHLGWCLGLFETAGIHVTMDTQLLLEAPRVFQQLINDGQFDKAEKLMEFRQRVLQTMELPRQLLAVYNQVNTIVEKEIKLLEDKRKLQQRINQR